MFNLLKSRHRAILGVDITSTAVKILEISSQNNEFIVENYGRELLPPQVMDGDLIKETRAVSLCVKKLIDRLHITCRQAVLAVPDTAIISRVIQIHDGLNDEEMEELIVSESDQYIPYPIKEINFDFDVLGPSQMSPNLLDVLIVASRAENVNQRVEVASIAGLDPIVIDVESYAVERVVQRLAKTLPPVGQNQTVAIIDIGAFYTHLFVVHQMKLVYSREEKFGDKQLIESIAERYKMTLEEAGSAKDTGELPSDYATEILIPFKESLLLQIKRALQFYYSTNQNEDVQYILLAGGLARLPGLIALIKDRLGIIATIANPFSCMTLG